MLTKLFAPLAVKILGGALVLALLAVAFQTIHIERLNRIIAVLRIDLTQAKARTETEIANHQATKKAYRDAQAEAERLEAERLARITEQQERINNDRLSAYNRRLADARAQYQRLRSQAGAGASGATNCQPVSVAGDTPGTAQAACADEFPAAERLRATENSIQLDELITAVQQHQAVPAN